MNNANENDKKNVFQERFRELVGDTATQEEIAKKVNTSRQNVGNWLNGKSKPDIYALAEIANGYNVSTDYLLGLTDIKTNDTTIQSICEYTGLSEIVTHNLMMWKEAKNDNRNVGFHNLETLNILFETPAFFLLLLYLRHLNYYSSEILKDADKNINEIDVGEMLGNDNDSDLCRYKVSEFINDIMNEKFDNRKIHNGTYHRVIDNFR